MFKRRDPGGDGPGRNDAWSGDSPGWRPPFSEELFRAVFEQSAIGVAVAELDGRPVLANAALERMLGYTAEELSRLTYHVFTYPPDLAVDAELAPQLVAGAINQYVVEKRYVRKDSRIVWGRLTVSLLRSPSGEPQFVLAMVEDITDRKSAERALVESEERFKSAFDGSGVGMALVAMNGELLRVNDALSHLLGYPAAMLVGRTFAELAHPEDLEAPIQPLRLDSESRIRSYQTELRCRHAAGHSVWTLLTVSLVRDSVGSPRLFVFQVQDITERRLVQEALQASELRYRRLVETAYEGVWTIDREGRTDYVNGRMAQMLGYTPEEMIGRPMFDFMDEQARAEASRNLERRKQGVQEMHEFRLLRKDGTPLWTLMSTNPIVGEGGEFLGALAMVTDITERKRTETALRDSESRYRGLVELAPDGIVVHCEGTIVFANETAARLFGVAQASDLVGRPVTELVHPDDRERLAKHIQRFLTGDTRCGIQEERLQRTDGTLFHAEIAAALVTYEGRLAAQAVIRDVTERRRAEAAVRELEQQLRHAQKMEAVGQLAGGVAHDFNNLLTVIRYYSDVLLDELAETSPLRPEVEEIHRTTARAESLTRQLLAFSRKQLLRSTVVDVNAIVSGVEPMLHRLIGEDIRIVIRPTTAVGHVMADPSSIEQVIVNLAVNARDAMPKGGTLTIQTADVTLDEGYAIRHSAVVPGEYVMLVVSDTGCGMDEATRSRIFEPFFTTKPVGRGTGLGLSTVYGIVKQSGGYIWCYSEPDQGSVFKIYLPRADDAGAQLANATATSVSARGSEVLLLVEDEEAVRTLSRRILERHGYTVLEARDGAHALGVAARYPARIDALVTDMVMPELGGREVFKALAAARPGLRVLYMSGYTEDDILRRGLADPGAMFLPKPFTAASLARAVRAVLDGRQATVGGEQVSA